MGMSRSSEALAQKILANRVFEDGLQFSVALRFTPGDGHSICPVTRQSSTRYGIQYMFIALTVAPRPCLDLPAIDPKLYVIVEQHGGFRGKLLIRKDLGIFLPPSSSHV